MLPRSVRLSAIYQFVCRSVCSSTLIEVCVNILKGCGKDGLKILFLADSLGVIILLARWRSRGGVNNFRSVADFHWRIASGSILWARRDPSPRLQQVSCHDNQSHDCLMMLVGFTAIRRREMGWADDDHPLVFLFLGSSGIGKRHTV